MAAAHRFTEHDNGTTAEVPVGATFSIELPENPTTGHRWTEPVLDGGSAAAGPDEFAPGGKGSAGQGGAHRFTFRMTSAGTTTIRLAYRRGWEAGTNAARQFMLTVVGRS